MTHRRSQLAAALVIEKPSIYASNHDASELLRLHMLAGIMQVLARHCIKAEFKISDCMFDGT